MLLALDGVHVFSIIGLSLNRKGPHGGPKSQKSVKKFHFQHFCAKLYHIIVDSRLNFLKKSKKGFHIHSSS